MSHSTLGAIILISSSLSAMNDSTKQVRFQAELPPEIKLIKESRLSLQEIITTLQEIEEYAQTVDSPLDQGFFARLEQEINRMHSVIDNVEQDLTLIETMDQLSHATSPPLDEQQLLVCLKALDAYLTTQANTRLRRRLREEEKKIQKQSLRNLLPIISARNRNLQRDIPGNN